MTSVNTLGALTHRNILKSLRNPDIVVFATAAPVAFALLFAFVLSLTFVPALALGPVAEHLQLWLAN